MRPHTVYRFYNAAGDVLYVGCTAYLPYRLEQHKLDKPWWTEVARVEWDQFDTKAEAYRHEHALILELKPRHAKGHSSYAGSGIRCAFDRFCGEEADRAYAVYASRLHQPDTKRVYHVCAEHQPSPHRFGFLSWVVETGGLSDDELDEISAA